MSQPLAESMEQNEQISFMSLTGNNKIEIRFRCKG